MSSTTFSSTITAMATTAVTFSVTSGELPPGLTLDPSTGILSGIPYLGGKFTYSVTARDAIGGATTVSYTQSVTADVAVDRVAGADRFATGVAISQNAYPDGAKVVFIANGLNFPDALSAGPAAASLGGPVLLTAPASLPGVVANEIRRLGPSRIVVVGGTGVVSDAVFAKLKTMAATVERWAGASRYATSAAIVKNAFKSGASTIFLASGNGYPDALSAASVASALGIPVLLVNGSSAHVDAATLSTLRSLSTGTVYLAGGTASISNGVAQDLANAMGGNEYRFSGADRFRTSQVLNEAAYDTDGTNTSNPRSPTVFLVSGLGFPDGLSAGPWAGGIVDAPLYLVPGTCVPNQVLADIHGLGATEVVLIGGTGVLSEAVAALTPC
jgi:putative cell wall-binding protein